MDSTSPPRGDRRRGEEAARVSGRDGRKRERSDIKGEKERKTEKPVENDEKESAWKKERT